jgi:hypothetical protein
MHAQSRRVSMHPGCLHGCHRVTQSAEDCVALVIGGCLASGLACAAVCTTRAVTSPHVAGARMCVLSCTCRLLACVHANCPVIASRAVS